MRGFGSCILGWGGEYYSCQPEKTKEEERVEEEGEEKEREEEERGRRGRE